jgi:hypothetical protein
VLAGTPRKAYHPSNAYVDRNEGRMPASRKDGKDHQQAR